MSGERAKGGKHHNLNRSSKHKQQRTYEKQAIRTAKNKKRQWEKHLKNNPNDIQSAIILKKNIGGIKND
jgi:hypothetical protein